MNEKLSGVLGWAGIACVAGGVIVRFTMTEREAVWHWSLIAGIVLILLYGVTQWREIFHALGRRQARYGALAASSVLIAAGIVVAVNFVLARQNTRWDLTAAKQYSLSPQSVQLVQSLEQPVRMLVFAQDVDFPRYRRRLGAYEYVSSQVELEYIDVDKSPAVAQQYEVQAYGTIVLEYDGRIERVMSDDEPEITNGLIRVIEGEEQRVYFIQGHGERSPVGTERVDYGGLAEALRLDNFIVDTVVIAQTGSVPTDASVVVVAGPTNDYLPGEIDIIRDYLEGGGKALFLLDPTPDAETPDQVNLISLVTEWGIDVGANVVVDVSGVSQLMGTGPTVPLASQYPPHPITSDFQLLTAFPLARSVTPVTGGAGDRQAETFAETSPQSWAETDLAELAGGEVSAGDNDPPGPVSIAAAVRVELSSNDGVSGSDVESEADDRAVNGETEPDAEPARVEARVAVIGDADFASNAFLGMQGNRDFALNTLNWLAEQENLIAIRPREPEERRITVTQSQLTNLLLLSFLFVPGAVIGAGVYTWWQRR